MALGYKVQQGEESGGVTLQQRLEEAASESRMFDQLHQSPRGTRTPRSLVRESEQQVQAIYDPFCTHTVSIPMKAGSNSTLESSYMKGTSFL